jgi:hypothetical protein
MPSLFDFAGSLPGKSNSSSIKASTDTFAMRAYSSSTRSDGSRVPDSKAEMSLALTPQNPAA